MPDLRLLDVMLFNYGTTTRTDFRNGEINTNPYKTVYKKKPACLRIRPPPLKNIHTLTEWKHPNIPTEMMVKPKEIVRTNPRHVQQKYEALQDQGREEVQRTRPRLVMTPAISMDDILDPQDRILLINDVYESTQQRDYCNVASSNFTNKAALSALPAPANPITLEMPQMPDVSPEWRMESVSWDGSQLRAHCDPTRHFYLKRPLRCEVCKVSAAVEAQRKLVRQMKRQ